MVLLYHATKATATCGAADIARMIVNEGFVGNDVWELTDVVFASDKPLRGWGGWLDAWVVLEVPDDALAHGHYPEKWWDDAMYTSACFAFPACMANQFPRRLLTADDLENESYGD